jgi:hypothetical protein
MRENQRKEWSITIMGKDLAEKDGNVEAAFTSDIEKEPWWIGGAQSRPIPVLG